MKTIDIIAALNRKEQRQFEQLVIRPHKRASLKKLYRCLKKNPQASKRHLFSKVFGQTYTPEQDTLFRNELRLLNKELEAFLIERQWQRTQDTHPYRAAFFLVQAYLERQQYGLFEQAWRKLYKKAQKNAWYELESELLEQYFLYQIKTKEINADLLLALSPDIKTAVATHEAHALARTYRLEAYYGFIQQNLYAMSSGQYPRARNISALQQSAPLPNEALLRLLDAGTQMYFVSGAAKIQLLQTALDGVTHLAQHPLYDIDLVTKMQATLALEYFMEGRYEEAHQLYHPLVKIADQLSERTKRGIFFNYLSNLVKLGRHQAAIDWYHQQEDFWTQSTPPMYRAQYFLCWAHLGLGDYEAAHKALLQQDLQDRPRTEEFYARTLLSLVYYHLNDLVMAERETYNLIQNDRYKIITEEAHIHQLRFIHQFYNLAGQLPNERRCNKLKTLLEKANAWFEVTQPKQTASPLLHQWLVQQIQQTLA